ncbi:RdgB/HAM1 family non-canonical purine NTP pyrophosphatase [Marinospirillum sp.]|uniref:RdgB/HAM1 family non-canonical purine NTP pyrophosphatase n=1 Tax=Marinospirillum sp. TaxID=2183934 RepID=UPI00286FC54F|nr:RdgB/HAM1 family non-canonical purine NTP pyrophosphatase [Marinospirillum sp.]MDR9469185.1 RdgB/HAM1 family non-canonical purine NTP pyrophosphatase [Marinospirillum sp.]
MSKLILASGNAGKLKEFSDLLQPLGWQVEPQSVYQVEEAEETGLTFVENALIKARNAAQATGCAALADDSGIEVDALKGAPGIYSARFAGPGSSDAQNNARLLQELAGLPPEERTARYWCVLALMRHALDPTPIIVQASWEGRVLTEAQGEGGFGYDPLFWLPDLNKTAAELSKEEKNRLSHRGRASLLLLEALQERQGQ